MKSTNQNIALSEKIEYLKSKQSADLMVLKNQYFQTINSLKPINIIKTATYDFISSPNLKSTLINGIIGLGTQYLSKNFLNEYSANPIKRTLGRLFKFAVKNIVGRR